MELINAVGKEDLRLLANQTFLRENSILVMVGPVNPEVEGMINKALEGL